MHDLVLRGGTVVDGSGGVPFVADVAIDGDRITEVNRAVGVAATGRDEIDAAGMVVTPGFIDTHSHLDGNVTWEQRLAPSSGHGVTTTIMGNCGVGFAPCRPADRAFTVALMEGIEDIPASVLDQGLPWAWESYPAYRDFLAGRRFDMNITGLVPHSSLRLFVMGERAGNGEPANATERAMMTDLVAEAVRGGAAGVGSTRLLAQATLAGVPAPSRWADEAELAAIADGMAQAGRGVFQVAPEFNRFPLAAQELAMLIRVGRSSGVPIVYSLKQSNNHPEGWQQLLELTAAARDEGVDVRPQVLARPTGGIITWECSFHRFVRSPTYRTVSHLPLAERVVALARPEVRGAILAETIELEATKPSRMSQLPALQFPLGDPPDYEPGPENSVAVLAEEQGCHTAELTYDLLMADGGHGAILQASGNYSDGDLEAARTMACFDGAVWGLGDAGAHSTIICDASAPTSMLTHWTRDRWRGPKMDLPFVVRRLTAEPAELFGLEARGRVAAGWQADLNVIDHDRLTLRRPRMVYDLPGGGKRLVQDAEGYVATIVNGTVVARHDQPTGACSGQLV
ncbi:MAG: N-acyl-D-amino-acid deacylase family protein [Acidimicrobiales bacterium]